MTQLEKIREELLKNNKVSRNWCLSWFCTRLGAHIITLKREGFEFNAHNEGGDYVYEVVKRPEEVINYPQVEVKKVEQKRLGFKLPPILA